MYTDSEGKSMTPREKLRKAGFALVTDKKVGMMRIVRWYDPVTHEVRSQGVALQILKDRENWKKIQAAKAASETPNV
jgi:hypothetical protein